MRWGERKSPHAELRDFCTRWVRRFAVIPRRDPWLGGWVWLDHYFMPQHYWNGAWENDPGMRYMRYGPMVRDDRYGITDCVTDREAYRDALAVATPEAP